MAALDQSMASAVLNALSPAGALGGMRGVT